MGIAFEVIGVWGWVRDMGYGEWGMGYGVWGLGVWVKGLGFRVQGDRYLNLQ